MQFSDKGYIIKVRKHGENSLIITLLSHEHGKISGYVKGGLSKKKLGLFQLGNSISFNAYGRLEETMPQLRGVELLRSYAVSFMESRHKLLVLECFCSLFNTCLPEKQELEFLSESIHNFFASVNTSQWLAKYAITEFSLLDFLGIGLDLSCCAATGTTENLAFVSPKSGKAVSYEAGLPFKDKLFGYPVCVVDKNYTPTLSEVADLLKLNAYFLNKNFFQIHNLKFPDIRANLLHQLELQYVKG